MRLIILLAVVPVFISSFLVNDVASESCTDVPKVIEEIHNWYDDLIHNIIAVLPKVLVSCS